jgi:hypothetical protein
MSQMIRLSFANHVAVVGRLTGGYEYAGIVNARKLFESGERKIGAIGGGARIEDGAWSVLSERFGVEPHDWDGCMMVPSRRVEDVLSFMRERDPQIYEITPDRELSEELCGKELPGQKTPILAYRVLALAQIEFLETVRQAGEHYHPDGIRVIRQFNCFGMRLPDDLFEKLVGHELISRLRAEDVASTKGGIKLGAAADGAVLLNNILSLTSLR